jgi:hypothetical protein
MQKLGWGAAELVPQGAKAAWGARMIIGQDGRAELVGDRQHAVGDDNAAIDALLGHMNQIAKPVDKVREMLLASQIRTDEAAEVTVYEDEVIKVAGNSNASHGYFYIAAWLKEGDE